MNTSATKNLTDRIDWPLFFLYLGISLIGVFAIFSVEYKTTEGLIFTLKMNYAKQIMWLCISIAFGFIIMLLDSKIFTSIPIFTYMLGILLLILVLFVHENVKGSKSWLPLGFFRFQPGELAKIFTALALSKYLSLQEVDFETNLRHRLTAIGIVILPALLVLLSSETGLALVYFSFFLAMYREGLPKLILIVGFSVMGLTILTLAVPKNLLFIVLCILLAFVLFLLRKQLRRSRELLIVCFAIWGISILFSQILVPYAFKNILKGYQVDRIYTMIGQEMPEEYVHQNEKGETQKKGSSQYNVKQSKIAIGSGGFIGKGPLNGTQTQGNFVPEQGTDFIFCSIGEQFGFVGSTILIALYVMFLLRIILIAERQRSLFSRVYAYCIAGIVFFHLFINVGMTIGLAPVIGIPLPMLSYGGTSFLTFSIFIFILLKLDTDRKIVLR
jgi:rod shape determining protein RodA